MSAPVKGGLGRGLGALIPTQAETPRPVTQPTAPAAVEPDVQAVYAEVPIDTVVPNPRQPRTVFDEEALAELVHSIREIGLLQPVVVRRQGSGYELIAGERRLRASREAGLTHIPVIVRQTEDDALLRDALLENLHRANLNALEEAAAYSQLLADFGCTQEELATRIGRSRPQVSNTLRLLRLPPEVQRRVAAGVLSAGHARALLSLDDPAAMEAMATRIVAEGLSVRSVEELVLLGDVGAAKEKKPRKARGRDGSMVELAGDVSARLADALDTRVTVQGLATPKARGRIVIDVADAEDLRRIADLIERA